MNTSNVREPNFENYQQDKEFRNLKRSLLTHIESQTPRENYKEKKELNNKRRGPEVMNKEETAMQCDRLGLELIKMG